MLDYKNSYNVYFSYLQLFLKAIYIKWYNTQSEK